MRLKHRFHVFGLTAALALAPPVHAAPRRVVSTFLCTDEYVFRLLPRERIAALSFLAADTHPIVSTIAGEVHGIDLIRGSTEDVLSHAPDLVVMYQGTLPKLRAHLVEAGVPFLEVPWANSLAQIRDVTHMLGARLGAPDRAAAMLVEMDRNLAAARAAARAPAVRTLIYEPNGYATAGTVTDEIMQDAGLSNAAQGYTTTRSGTIPIEAVVAAAPELLILNGDREASIARADLVLRHPALAALGTNTFVARIALTPLLCPGPWSAQSAPVLAKLGRQARALARGGTRP